MNRSTYLLADSKSWKFLNSVNGPCFEFKCELKVHIVIKAYLGHALKFILFVIL